MLKRQNKYLQTPILNQLDLRFLYVVEETQIKGVEKNKLEKEESLSPNAYLPPTLSLYLLHIIFSYGNRHILKNNIIRTISPSDWSNFYHISEGNVFM